MMAKTGRICAVVVTYNRKTLLEECLTALLNQTRPLDEVIVIDNASTDGTEDIMRTRFADVTYVRLAENIGGAGGFHEGMKLAFEKGHDWIWVMDDDAIPLADALGQLVNCPMMHEEKVYAVASTVLQEDGSISLVHRRLFNPKKMIEVPVSVDKYLEDFFQVDMVSFVGPLISRKAIDEIGLPLKDFFIYNDDSEYSLRLRGRGTILTVSSSKILHRQRWDDRWDDSNRLAIIRRPLSWKYYYASRNYIHLCKMHGRLSALFYGKLLRQVLMEIGITLLFRHSKLKSIKIIFWSTLDGFRGRLGKNINFLPD